MRTPVIGAGEIPVLRRPEWIKVRAPGGATYERLFALMRCTARRIPASEPDAR